MRGCGAGCPLAFCAEAVEASNASAAKAIKPLFIFSPCFLVAKINYRVMVR